MGHDVIMTDGWRNVYGSTSVGIKFYKGNRNYDQADP